MFRSLLLAGLALATLASRTEAQLADPALLTANPYLGAPIPPFDPRVSPWSPIGATNPHTVGGGRIYAQDGTYLGRLNANPYDAESVANPHGPYGSPWAANSIRNPHGLYGSPYSHLSPTNPYTATPPVVVYTRP